jgi:hypothetical protein
MRGVFQTAPAAGLLLVLALMEIAPAKAQMGGFRKKGMMGGTSARCIRPTAHGCGRWRANASEPRGGLLKKARAASSDCRRR